MESDTRIKTEPVWLQKDQEMYLDMKEEELNPGMHSLGEEDNNNQPGTSNSDLLEDEFMKNIELKNEITIENHDICFEDKEESSPDTTSNPACEKSGEVFLNSEELSKNNIPSKKHLYKCAICPKSFPCKSHLSSHMRSHNDKKSHQCEQCGKVLQTKCSLVVHRITHIAKQPFKCEVCGRMFQSRPAHRVHIKKHMEPDNKLYSCDICCLDFKTNRILLNHLRTHDGQLLYKCTICDKAYVRECQLEKHSSRMHSWKCNFCGKEFNGSSAITHHIRTHTGERPFKCNFCDKTFTQQSHLTRHLKIHTSVPELIKTKRDIQVYSCNFCEKKFVQCSALVKHTIITGHSTALSML